MRGSRFAHLIYDADIPSRRGSSRLDGSLASIRRHAWARTLGWVGLRYDSLVDPSDEETEFIIDFVTAIATAWSNRSLSTVCSNRALNFARKKIRQSANESSMEPSDQPLLSTMTTHPPCRKRKRTDSDASLPTPPSEDPTQRTFTPQRPSRANENQSTNTDDPKPSQLETSLHVLRTEAAALANITTVYTTLPACQSHLHRALTSILTTQRTNNRLIACGVGKSAFIAQKFVATCKSLSIAASFLHACEAVHGDLGDVRSGDVVLFVSYSGRTPELLNLLPHLPRDVTVIALTGQVRVEDCRLLDGLGEDVGILLPAPVEESEEASFGVAAPTTSTTVALAVADMLALTVAGEMHGNRKREVFKRNHPGGAIGMKSVVNEVKRARREVDVTVLELPSPSISGEDDR